MLFCLMQGVDSKGHSGKNNKKSTQTFPASQKMCLRDFLSKFTENDTQFPVNSFTPFAG
jgi:hypothetical protein